MKLMKILPVWLIEKFVPAKAQTRLYEHNDDDWFHEQLLLAPHNSGTLRFAQRIQQHRTPENTN